MESDIQSNGRRPVEIGIILGKKSILDWNQSVFFGAA